MQCQKCHMAWAAWLSRPLHVSCQSQFPGVARLASIYNLFLLINCFVIMAHWHDQFDSWPHYLLPNAALTAILEYSIPSIMAI